jgi:excisionase family DNA binding protein
LWTIGVLVRVPLTAVRRIRTVLHVPRTFEYTLTTGTVAEILEVSQDTVSRWADEGLLPHLRTPGKWRRFRPTDVERFKKTAWTENGAA